jgi:hypothetical protein
MVMMPLEVVGGRLEAEKRYGVEHGLNMDKE